jgi:cytochrome o ubiquinol oxidase subunit II
MFSDKKMLLRFLLGLSVIALGVIGITVVLHSKHALIVHPKGIIAEKELELIVLNILLMLLIILPTYAWLFTVVWKYCIKNERAVHDPNYRSGPLVDLMMWGCPFIIVAVMAFVTWDRTHALDPYKSLESEKKPLLIQVIALDWKWLFIYPELGIASLNYLFIPERTPIHLRLTADGAPMNSFWIPQLSGQIYSMTGMSTQLHLMADGPGEYKGRAVEINGEGYSDMTFSVKSDTLQNFEEWVKQVKTSSFRLTEDIYRSLVAPSVNKSVVLFSEVDEELYHRVVHQYMFPAETVL